jgi:hypothetical protein
VFKNPLPTKKKKKKKEERKRQSHIMSTDVPNNLHTGIEEGQVTCPVVSYLLVAAAAHRYCYENNCQRREV